MDWCFSADGTYNSFALINPEASSEEIAVVEKQLTDSDSVLSFSVLNQEQLWAAFEKDHSRQADVLAMVEPSDMGTAYLVDFELDADEPWASGLDSTLGGEGSESKESVRLVVQNVNARSYC